MDNNINKYIIEHNETNLISIFNIIFISVLLILLILSYVIRIDTYTEFRSIVWKENNTYYLKIESSLQKSKYIIDNKTIYIDDTLYKYEIKKISNIYVKNNKNYQKIYIKTDLNPKYKINNLILSIKIKGKKQRIINSIVNYFGKES